MNTIKMVTKLSLLGVILVSGCIGGSEQVRELEGSVWNLVEIDGMAILPDSGVSLKFADGQASGSAGCNSYSGEYKVGTGGSIEFGMMAWTLMACMEPEGLMEQETAYMRALGEVVIFNLSGEELTMQNESGSVLLVFGKEFAE